MFLPGFFFLTLSPLITCSPQSLWEVATVPLTATECCSHLHISHRPSVLPVTSSVSLAKPLNLSEHQFPLLNNGEIVANKNRLGYAAVTTSPQISVA